jgi:hypothetical protein
MEVELRIKIGVSCLGLAVVFGWGARSQGASLDIAYTSLERIIVKRVMTESALLTCKATHPGISLRFRSAASGRYETGG